MELMVALILVALFTWLIFRYQLSGASMLSRGLARKNGWKKASTSVLTCGTCGNEIETKEETAYCENCRAYV
ncbi:hypothetical protein ACFO4L_11340 [Bacillus daqingensis]|uniref:YhfH family protein n=1 Tax=Bacillus daqingensis TaxID=872396 RepID=A0ABV9NUW9_9BACI